MKKQASSQPLLSFSGAKEWRNWLADNHTETGAVWLLIKKKHALIPGLTYQEALDEALCYGWIDGQMRSKDKETFIQRFSPRRKKSVWSLINKNRCLELIREGRMTPAGMAAIEEAKNNGAWESAYTSKTDLPFPSDLQHELKKKPPALLNFDDFSRSVRNIYIGWVEGAKRPATREARIDQVVQWALDKRRPE